MSGVFCQRRILRTAVPFTGRRTFSDFSVVVVLIIEVVVIIVVEVVIIFFFVVVEVIIIVVVIVVIIIVVVVEVVVSFIAVVIEAGIVFDRSILSRTRGGKAACQFEGFFGP